MRYFALSKYQNKLESKQSLRSVHNDCEIEIYRLDETLWCELRTIALLGIKLYHLYGCYTDFGKTNVEPTKAQA